VRQLKDTLILDELQAVTERWTNKALLESRAVSMTMRYHHALHGTREGVRNSPETGWASSNRESMPTSVFRREMNSCAAIFAD
jgi:hypothetical protein